VQVLEEILSALLQRFKLGRTLEKKVAVGCLVRAPQDTSSLLSAIITFISNKYYDDDDVDDDYYYSGQTFSEKMGIWVKRNPRLHQEIRDMGSSCVSNSCNGFKQHPFYLNNARKFLHDDLLPMLQPFDE